MWRERVERSFRPGLNLVIGAKRGKLIGRVPARLVARGQARIDLGGPDVIWIGSGEVDQIDVLVTWIDALDLDAGRHHQLPRLVDPQAPLADESSPNASLFEHLAQGGCIGQLIGLDMAAGRQPPAEFAVIVQQHALVVHDEHGHREVAQDLSGRNWWVLRHASNSALGGGGPVYPAGVEESSVVWLNAMVRRYTLSRLIVSALARWLAAVEIALMLALGVSGRRESALRMLVGVGLVYVASDALGMLWPRPRPFASMSEVAALTPHSPTRSFPSRHVASGLAMAAIGGRAHPRLGFAMSLVAWTLGVSRIAAGLHYPSDVLGGAALGALLGRYAYRA